ncbi:MAG: capsid protein [Hangzhou dicistrovirus 2]|nr:MAG: capsid protein [Hangzhou dicistrovirus 2]
MINMSQHNTRAPNAIASTSTSGEQSSLLTDGQQQHEQYDVVQFSTNATVTETHYEIPEQTTKLLDSLHIAEEQTHSIQSFLSRPVEIASGTFSATAAGTSYLDLIVSFATLPQVFQEKLRGFYAGTFNIKFKLLVNAQPFESGIVMMCWQPQYEADPNRYILVGQPNGLSFMSGLPCSYLNFANESEINLSVPYVATSPAMAFANTSKIGRISLVNFAPLRSGTNAPTVPYTLYVSLENVSMIGVTATPQGLPSGPAERKHATKISTIARDIANIPMLSAVAPEIPMVANTVANVASSLGFSKPTVPYSESTVIKNDPLLGGENADGAIPSHKFSVYRDCLTSSRSVAYSNEDEMSIAALVKDPNYLYTVTWNKDQAAGSRLTWFYVNPNCYTFDKEHDRDTFYPNRLRYISQQFMYWRGGIKFHFQFAATKFHSGRVRIGYIPLSSASSVTYDMVKQYGYSQVYDLRDGTDVVIECPYLSISPWRTVPFVKSGNTFGTGYVEGILFVYVENSLRAPDTASQSIDFVVSVSGSDDFQVSTPIGGIHGYRQTADRPQQAVEDFEGQKKSKSLLKKIFKPQGVELNAVTGLEAFSRASDTSPSELCTGEQIISLRPLMRRLEYMGVFSQSANSIYALFPFFYKFANPGIDDGDPTIFGAIRALFLFYRGSMRFVLNNETAGPMSVHYSPINSSEFSASALDIRKGLASVTTSDGKAITIEQMTQIGQSVAVPINQTPEGVVDIIAPFYSKYPQLFNVYYDKEQFGFSAHASQVNTGSSPCGIFYFSSPNQQKTRIYRAGGDDFSCFGMLGAPYCYVDNYVRRDAI